MILGQLRVWACATTYAALQQAYNKIDQVSWIKTLLMQAFKGVFIIMGRNDSLHILVFIFRTNKQKYPEYGHQIWNLSNILHDRIFGPTILHSKNMHIAAIFANNKAA